ncbi:MAG: ATP-binding protein [Pseudomonadota bacterium]
MPLLAVAGGLLLGSLLWWLLDSIQSSAIQAVFQGTIQEQLRERARQGLLKFQDVFDQWGSTTRLLANHRRLALYLDQHPWPTAEAGEPTLHQSPPPWLPEDWRWQSPLVPPCQVILTDQTGRPREIFQIQDTIPSENPVPPALSWQEEAAHVPFRLVHEEAGIFLAMVFPVKNAADVIIAGLELVVPVDDRFLMETQQRVALPGMVAAIIDADTDEVVASSEPSAIPASSSSEDWQERYFVTLRSFPDYEESDWDVSFAIFFPKRQVAHLVAQALKLERQHRLIEALVLGGSFTLLLYLLAHRHQALVRTKALKTAILEAAGDPIVTLDEQGRVVEANPVAMRLLGHRQAFLGLDFARHFLVEADADRLEKLLSDDSHSGLGPPVRHEINARCEDGSALCLELSLVSLTLGRRRYFTLYLRDITRVRAAEEQARQHQARLIHVARYNTAGELATGLAHEINQPLAAIANFANGCLRRLPAGMSTEELTGALDDIRLQAARGGAIIKRLRALMARKPLERGSVELGRLAREAIRFVAHEARHRGVEITVETATPSCQVWADAIQVEQVVLNFLLNALDALEGQPADRRRIRILVSGGEDSGRLVVEDLGPGILKEHQNRLFEPFFTTKDHGMGMGLAISKTIVEDHGGRIRLEPGSAGGTRALLELPASPNSPRLP